MNPPRAGRLAAHRCQRRAAIGHDGGWTTSPSQRTYDRCDKQSTSLHKYPLEFYRCDHLRQPSVITIDTVKMSNGDAKGYSPEASRGIGWNETVNRTGDATVS